MTDTLTFLNLVSLVLWVAAMVIVYNSAVKAQKVHFTTPFGLSPSVWLLLTAFFPLLAVIAFFLGLNRLQARTLKGMSERQVAQDEMAQRARSLDNDKDYWDNIKL